MTYIVKLPFARLYFCGLTPEGYLAWSTDDAKALRFASRERVRDYLPAEVPASMFVLVEVP